MSSVLLEREIGRSEIELAKDKTDNHAIKNLVCCLTRKYIGGIWNYVELNDFKCIPILGGQTNHLYRCIITNDALKIENGEPNNLLLRLYGDKKSQDQEIIDNDIKISQIVSDNNLGPKIYAVFENGRFEELLPGRSIEFSEMIQPCYSVEIARQLAHFHTLKIPIEKNSDWLFSTIQKFINEVKTEKFDNEVEREKYEKFMSYDFEEDLNRLKPIILSLNSPIVFCHNDVNTGNTLKLQDKIKLIDYEYGSYNFRGFDIANHFCEWMFNNNHNEYPYFSYNYESYPNREQQLHFLKNYIDEFEKYEGINTINELNCKHIDEEKLLKEIRYFSLTSHLFWSMWAVLQANLVKINFQFLDYALARSDAYFKHKKLIFPDDKIE